MDSRDAKEEERWNAAARDVMSAKKAAGRLGMDLIWTHPTSGGRLYLGDVGSAQNEEALKQYGITHIVNCTRELPLYMEGKGGFTYYRFVISESWRIESSDVKAVQEFFAPALEFVHDALRNGKHVLSHCLAGAHRSAMHVLLYLYRYWKRDPDYLCALIVKRRPIAQPTLYMSALEKASLWILDVPTEIED